MTSEDFALVMDALARMGGANEAFSRIHDELVMLMAIEKATRERYAALAEYRERSWHGDEAEADAWVKYLKADVAVVRLLDGGGK